MVSPRTFYGYDESSNCIASCPAQDATYMIDPSEVKAALDNLSFVLTEELNRIASALQDVQVEDAIVVQGTNMSGMIDDTATAISQIPNQIINSLSSIYDYSVYAHDSLQNGYNQDAYDTVRGKSGVVRISG
jgi:hypothetical protein